MTDEMRCPRRGETAAVFRLPEHDEWRERDGARVCSYCGSAHPDDFFAAIERGEEIGPTDKSYKAYVGKSGGQKFYFQHLDAEQRHRFIDLVNAGKVNIGYPGHFYVLPFFCTRAAS